MNELMAGAEPMSVPGGPAGALVLHGFTGSPDSMRGVATGLAAVGFTVELPRLPGHGTTVEDMLTTRWSDWSTAAEDAYFDLAGRCESVVVAGLSMGATLTLWLAARHPQIAGIACVNPATRPQPPEVVAMIEAALDGGDETMAGIGSDIAKDGVVEVAYELTPLRPLLSLVDALDELQEDLSRISCPLLLLTSPQDHVVDPGDSDHLAAEVSGPVTRVSLEQSYHVATQDHDAGLVVSEIVAFARTVSEAPAP